MVRGEERFKFNGLVFKVLPLAVCARAYHFFCFCFMFELFGLLIIDCFALCCFLMSQNCIESLSIFIALF